MADGVGGERGDAKGGDSLKICLCLPLEWVYRKSFDSRSDVTYKCKLL